VGKDRGENRGKGLISADPQESPGGKQKVLEIRAGVDAKEKVEVNAEE